MGAGWGLGIEIALRLGREGLGIGIALRLGRRGPSAGEGLRARGPWA